MAAEIIGELIVGVVELGVEIASEDKKSNGCGCIFGILISLYYFI